MNDVPWRERLDADIALLRGAHVRPLALIWRLREVRDGMPEQSQWPEFKVPGRGRSHQGLDTGILVVTLEFRRQADAHATLEQLHKVQEKLRVITAIESRTVGGGMNVRLVLEPRPTI